LNKINKVVKLIAKLTEKEGKLIKLEIKEGIFQQLPLKSRGS
jgi:hypothetical protein